MYKQSLTDITSLKPDEFKSFIDSFDTVLTDCDGVLWLEGDAIEGAPEVLNRLRKLGKRIVYVTNNSTKNRDEYAAKAQKLNFIAKKEEIVSAAYLVATYLKSIGFQKKLYLIGSNGIGQELDLVGIKHTGIGPDIAPELLQYLADSVKLDPDVGAVVVGFDHHISFMKMLRASSYLKNPDCLFVASNTDEVFPLNSTLVVPGTGSLVRSIETITGRKATVLGKPNEYISEVLAKMYSIVPGRTLMIGDRCNTDILLGTRCGFQTLLVLTGVSTLDYVNGLKESKEKDDRDLIPDVYINSLGDLLKYIR